MEPQTLEDTSTAEAPGQNAPAPPPTEAPTPAEFDIQNTTPVTPRIRRKNAGDVENIFTYHAPFGDQQQRYIEIRAHAQVMARMLKRNCFESRELSLALTHLQQAVMWANAGIAINEQDPSLTDVPLRDL